MNGLDSRTIIVMATFNGENFLGGQLNSLMAQSDRSWDLLIREDGSEDCTEYK